ncbi:PRC-barrel domain-containing protein [Adhaeretor mobilis]|uniref:PRC-barrel domain protein n=1 Tax=Adhaeretor mobilis TaxID=1930276 RepID=A0A517MX80_9BACT|nr:PRC-barrel domain-containing protein [Adhaeretor mobilis]QDS99481.1 PRC-barrel domain protein [Adhaeretor mobilis]
MKSYYTLTATMAILAAVAFTYTATAQNATTNTRNHNAQQRDMKQMRKGNFGKIDSVMKGSHFRASQVIGANIYNMKEESVGEISDVVLDASTGRIAYAAVTYGGFLGIGDKMFAVPWEAFRVKAEKDDADDYHLCLDVSQERLDGAEGFDQDHWPNFGDRNWKMQLDKRYGVDRRMDNRDGRRNRVRDGNVDVDVNRNGVDVDVDRDN